MAKEKAIADEEGRKVAAINDEVSAKQASCETDLKRAEPALAAAEAALNILDKVTLNKSHLLSLRLFWIPQMQIKG